MAQETGGTRASQGVSLGVSEGQERGHEGAGPSQVTGISDKRWAVLQYRSVLWNICTWLGALKSKAELGSITHAQCLDLPAQRRPQCQAHRVGRAPA